MRYLTDLGVFMNRYIFLVFLAFLTTGCIPKYVDQKPSSIPVKTPEVKVKTPVEISKPEVKTEQVVEHKEVIEEQKSSKSYKVTMKTKKFAFSDTGFLVEYKDSYHLNVLAMGKSVLDLKVKKDSDDICVGSLCNTKHGFNQSFLVGSYPDTFMENLLQKKPIFNGKHLTKTSNGFVQKIVCERYGIKYQVSNTGIYFKDRKNNILIKLRELKQ
jgi:hypothetical protein